MLTGAILGTFLVLVACGTTTPTPPISGNTIPVPTVLATLPPNTPQAALTIIPPDTIAILNRSGGFTGQSDTYVIKRDGTVVDGAMEKEVKGGARAANALADKIRATGIYAVEPGRYFPKETCCDRRTYTLTLVQDGKTYVFITLENTDTTPPALVETLKLVEEYIGTAQ